MPELLLSFKRMQHFFPESRLALDLNSDRLLKVGFSRSKPYLGKCQSSRTLNELHADTKTVMLMLAAFI